MISNQVVLREMEKDDESFIYSSWLRSYRGSPITTHMINDVYYDNHKKIIEKLLLEAKVIIACNPEDPSQIYGFICYEDGVPNCSVVHYLYVKYPFRKMGLGTHLFDSICSDATLTIVTHYNSNIKNKLDNNLIYNPYLLYRR